MKKIDEVVAKTRKLTEQNKIDIAIETLRDKREAKDRQISALTQRVLDLQKRAGPRYLSEESNAPVHTN